jgi:protein TonB
MPANLFDPDLRPAPVGGARRLTVTTSIIAHVMLVLLIVVLPLVGGVSMPSAMERIDAFIAPALPEMPALPAAPPPSSAQPVNAPNPNAAPTQAPDGYVPEVIATPVPSGIPTAPGGLPYVPGTGVPGGLPGLATPPPAVRVEPKPSEPVRVGGLVTPPRRISYVPPAYPKIAEAARVEGTVTLEALIDEAGVVRNLRVIGSVPFLDDAAKDAVSRWRYSPTTLNGEKVAVLMTVRVTFTLR